MSLPLLMLAVSVGGISSTQPHLDPLLSSVRRTTSGLPLSDRLSTKVSPVKLGEPVLLECNSEQEVESCHWIHHQQRFARETSGPSSCHLLLEDLTKEQLGTWKCHVVIKDRPQFQEAHIHLTNEPEETIENIRLPSHVLPTKYDLYALPFIIPDNWTIAGLVTIDLDVVAPSDNITLHIFDITIHESDVEVNGDEEANIPVIGHGYDEERQFYIIQLGKSLVANTSITVTIPFTGILNSDLAGFYRSSYVNAETGETHWIATTQFEATSARRAFPCLDEPDMKARFSVNLGRLPDMSTISNMPLKEGGFPLPDTDYVLDIYEESVRMSTYLLAFVVSDFVYRESEPLDNGVRFRIWSRAEAYQQTKLAATVGPLILQYYEQYFNTTFPLPKQDMIAIPDFAAGAMENWGLITYREVAILYEEGVSSDDDKEGVVDVIAHELAHQWFGNLVTMEWWTDLWLNEGFATYTQANVGSDVVMPEAENSVNFVMRVQSSLAADSLLSSHPISVVVNDPAEINQIFDGISYGKGASVIKMMANFLKLETFNRGISNYLHGNAFDNANQDSLWEYLTEVAIEDEVDLVGNSVKDIMDTWTLLTGYPVISVLREGNLVTLSQERFLVNPKAEPETVNYWWVPISYSSPGTNNWEDTLPSLWMPPNNQTSTLILEAVDITSPLIVNVKQTGFYRVNYDLDNWSLISNSLRNNHTSIDRGNRAQILDDAFNIAKAGLLDYSVALDQTSYLSEEYDYLPWRAALNGLTYLAKMLRRSSGFGDYTSYLFNVLSPVYARLGFDPVDGEPLSDAQLRVDVLSELCRAGHADCVARSVDLMDQWIAAPNPDSVDPIPGYVRAIALCTAIKAGTSNTWDFLYQRFLNSNNAGSKITYLGALACSREDWVLERFLAMSMDETSGVKKQDGERVIQAVASKTLGRYIAWNWIRFNWVKLSEYFDANGGSGSRFARIITTVADDFNTEFDLKELEQFIVENKDHLGTAEAAAKQMVEQTKGNIFWMETHYNEVVDWLVKH